MLLQLEWWNDAFTGQHTDDNGFTNDVALALTGQNNAFALRQRMITERGGPKRIDEIDVIYSRTHTWQRGRLSIDASINGGVVVAGNTGGAELQNWFHHLPLIKGRWLGHGLKGGLQNEYDGALRAAPVFGGTLGVSFALFPKLFLYDAASANAAPFSTGVSSVSDEVGARAKLGTVTFTVGALGECRWSNDKRLGILGGYALSQCSVAPTASVQIDAPKFSLAWRLRQNEGGGGQATAAIETVFKF